MSIKAERKARKTAAREAREEQKARKIVYYVAGGLLIFAILFIAALACAA